jgi:segregation and condensation protein B
MANRNEKLAEALPLADAPDGADPQAPHQVRENVMAFPSSDTQHQLRILEALLFAASGPLDELTLAERLPNGADVPGLLSQLAEQYRTRGVNLVRVAGKWAFRTADDLSFIMRKDAVEEKRLSRAALETLAIIAYHQPVTRAEIEDVRGVSISKGTLDALLEIGWIRMRGRRRTPGRPVTYGITERFLDHFGLADIKDLPGVADLKAAGLLDSDVPADFVVPDPSDIDTLTDEEDPLEDGDLDTFDETESSEEC